MFFSDHHSKKEPRIQLRSNCVILGIVNILILPSLCIPAMGSAVLTARNLAELFQMEQIRCAICADESSSFHGVSFYGAKAPVSFSRKETGRSYEEYQKAYGALRGSWLKKDYESISSAIQRFEPDLLLEIGRPAAFAAGKEYGIAVCSVLSAPMFRNTPFPYSVLNSLNEFLRSRNMEQVIRLSDLSRQSKASLCFGPQCFQPIPVSYPLIRCGFSAISPLEREQTSRLSIVFSEASLNTRRTKKIICEAFQRAPYEVQAFLPVTPMEKRDNIRFQNRFLLSCLNGSRACIHDGNEAVMLYCISLGIPQLIVHDSSYQRSWNAACIRRAGIGLSLSEAEFSMERLYETYRALCVADLLETRTLALREETLDQGNLSVLPSLLSKLL